MIDLQKARPEFSSMSPDYDYLQRVDFTSILVINSVLDVVLSKARLLK